MNFAHGPPAFITLPGRAGGWGGAHARVLLELGSALP